MSGSELALISTWASRERRARYRQTSLAAYWGLAYPVAMLAIYGWMFSVVLDVRGDGLPYLAFASAGLVPWAFLAAALTSAGGSIVYAAPTLSAVRFPREIIPLGAMWSNVIELTIGVGVLVVLAMAHGIGLAVTAAALPVVGAILLLWVASVCVLLAAVSVFVRDVRQGLPLLLQLAFIATPVMYPPSLLPSRFDWIAEVSPMAVVVEATRDVVLRHVWPDWTLLAVHAVAGAVALAAALAYCRSVEVRFAEVA